MKRMVGLFVCMLLITTLLPISVMAGDEAHPEISDITGDARKSVDIKEAWFCEDQATPEYLYVTIQVVKLRTLYYGSILHDVLWTMNDVDYITYSGVGIYMLLILHRNDFWAGVNRAYPNNGSVINGTLNLMKGTITYKIPKSAIGNPQPGDVLTKTNAWASQRTPLMEWIGWDAMVRNWAFGRFGLNTMLLSDHAPETGYGSDYTILY